MWPKVARAMEKQGISSIVKLGEIADIPASTIYTWKQDYEKGEHLTKPSIDNLVKLSKALNVEITDLL